MDLFEFIFDLVYILLMSLVHGDKQGISSLQTHLGNIVLSLKLLLW